MRKQLIVFDSFSGLPKNNELHINDIFNNNIRGKFSHENFCGTLKEVKANVREFGDISSCGFIAGYYEETMPSFQDKLCAIYLDVDLASSTRTCLRYLYPKLVSGGIVVSQDGLYPLVLDVFNDDRFWETELCCKKPIIHGLHKDIMLKIIKE